MIKRMNRKGQEGGVGPLMIGLIIVGVLAVLIVLFVTGVFNPINTGTTTFTPTDIDFRYNSCKLLSSGTFPDTYCEFKKITSTKYLNCESPSVKSKLVADGGTTFPSCPTPDSFCKGKNGKIAVNEKTCAEWECLTQGEIKDNGCDKDKIEIKDMPTGKFCCKKTSGSETIST